jgi:hypothetical protein
MGEEEGKAMVEQEARKPGGGNKFRSQKAMNLKNAVETTDITDDTNSERRRICDDHLKGEQEE